MIIRAPKNNANITTQDFTNSESDCGGWFFFSRFFLFSHGFSPSGLSKSVSQDDESQLTRCKSPISLSRPPSCCFVIHNSDWVHRPFSRGHFFLGVWALGLFVGWALNGIYFRDISVGKFKNGTPLFCWILRNERAERCCFWARVTMTLFLMKCELLPFYCHLPLMWITKRTRSTYVEKDFPFWKPCLKLPLIWKFHRTFH